MTDLALSESTVHDSDGSASSGAGLSWLSFHRQRQHEHQRGMNAFLGHRYDSDALLLRK